MPGLIPLITQVVRLHPLTYHIVCALRCYVTTKQSSHHDNVKLSPELGAEWSYEGNPDTTVLQLL